MIDLITNSSTEIFINSSKSIEPAKELLSELLKLAGSYKTCDEVFEVSLTMDTDYLVDILRDQMENYDEENYIKLGLDDLAYTKSYEVVEQYVNDVMKGKIEKPKYFEEMIDDMEIGISTYLHVVSKDSKYDHFLEILEKLLYSPDYEEGSC